MKRTAVYFLLVLAAILAPVEKLDVAKLRPIEVVYISAADGAVLLQTDAKDIGFGRDVESALEDMKKTSPAVIYLDTARYLLIGPGGEGVVKQLQGILKDNVQLCKADDKIPLDDVAEYLPVHGKLPEFDQWEEGEKLPVLHLENDRIKIS